VRSIALTAGRILVYAAVKSFRKNRPDWFTWGLILRPKCICLSIPWTGCSGSVIRSVALLPGRYVVNFPPPSAWNARASLGITRSNQYPNFGASGYVAINRLSRNGETPIPVELLPQQNRNFSRARPFIKPRLEVRKEQEDQEHDGIPLEGNFPLLPGLPQRIYSDPSRLTSLIRAASAADLCVLHRRIKGMRSAKHVERRGFRRWKPIRTESATVSR
jgi:hypothetical protein